MNSISLEKTQSPVSGFCYARNRICDAINIRIFKWDKHFNYLKLFKTYLVRQIKDKRNSYLMSIVLLKESEL